MATYYFCDGNTRVATTITMTQTSRPNTYITTSSGTFSRSWARLTFTATVAPLQSLRLYYNYETRNRILPNLWQDNWYTVQSWVTLNAGQTSTYIDVMLSEDACFGDGDDDGIYPTQI